MRVSFFAMYAFLLFSLPLAFLLLVARLYPKAEYQETKIAFLRGLIAALPIWFLARLLGSIVPDMPGSMLQILHEWADRFLPYALLPALAYPVFYRYGEKLAAGTAQRRLCSFYAGCLCLTGLGETLRLWGKAGAYEDLVLPFLVAATSFALPRLVLDILSGYGSRRALLVAASVAATLALSSVLPLFLAQLWPLALFLAAGLCFGAWFYAYPGLARANRTGNA